MESIVDIYEFFEKFRLSSYIGIAPLPVSCILQALSNLHYLFNGFINYFWSWMKCAGLVRRSTMTQIVLFSLDVLEEPDLPIPVLESFHEQTYEELIENDIKWLDVDDKAIQTILLGLLEDVYVAADSCETAKEI
nr:hypothetical protein [Tanacetum cinerariifolium]